MKLVEEMVAAKWRQQRIWVIQTTALDLEMDSQRAEFHDHEKQNGPLHLTQPSRIALAFTAIANKEKTLELLLRYETSFSRMHDRAVKAFYHLREKANLRNDPKPPPPSPETDEPEWKPEPKQTKMHPEAALSPVPIPSSNPVQPIETSPYG